MKLVSLALIVLFGRANSSSVTTSCVENCKEIRNDLLSEPHTCNPALTISPLPDVYKSCQTGKKAAFDKACVPLCNGEETTTASLTSSASIACRSNRGRGPADYWCRRGFSSILKKLEGYSFPAVEESIIEETGYEAVMSSAEAEAEAEAKSKEEESLEEKPEESKDEGIEKELDESETESLEEEGEKPVDENLEVEEFGDENLKEEQEESQDENLEEIESEDEVDEATDATEPAEEIVGEVEYAGANEF